MAKEDTKRIVSLTRGDTICERVTLADRPLQRMRGLLGRRALALGEGLLLRPEPAIHTAFMRFSIDALFLDLDLQVVDIIPELGPWRVAGKRGAHAVLELAAGEAARRGVQLGDRLGVFDRKFVASIPNEDGKGAGQPSQWDFLPNSELVPALGEPARDGGRRPAMRVLLIARDRRFRTVASALLTRRGCEVATSATAVRATELIEREGSDVVVVDAGALLTSAVRTVAALESLMPPVGVVVVADHAEAGLHHLPVLAKWGPFEDIFAAIEQAARDRGHRSPLVG